MIAEKDYRDGFEQEEKRQTDNQEFHDNHTHGAERLGETNFYADRGGDGYNPNEQLNDGSGRSKSDKFSALWKYNNGVDAQSVEGLTRKDQNQVNRRDEDNKNFVKSIADTAELSQRDADLAVELFLEYDGRRLCYLGGDVEEVFRFAVVEVASPFSPFDEIERFKNEVELRMDVEKFNTVVERLLESDEYKKLRYY